MAGADQDMQDLAAWVTPESLEKGRILFAGECRFIAGATTQDNLPLPRELVELCLEQIDLLALGAISRVGRSVDVDHHDIITPHVDISDVNRENLERSARI